MMMCNMQFVDARLQIGVKGYENFIGSYMENLVNRRGVVDDQGVEGKGMMQMPQTTTTAAAKAICTRSSTHFCNCTECYFEGRGSEWCCEYWRNEEKEEKKEEEKEKINIK